MSTMYDALKKAEEERKRTSGVKGTISPASSSSSVSNAQEMSDKIKSGLLLIAVIAVFVFVFFRLKGIWEHKAPVVQPTLIPGEAKLQHPPGTYTLDGVIDGQSPMAIINGKLVKIDESIDQLVLKKISAKEAELVNTKDNSTVVLRIN